MALELRWHLAADVALRRSSDGMELAAPGRPVAALPQPAPELAAAIDALLSSDGLAEADAPPLMPLLLRLCRARLVEWRVPGLGILRSLSSGFHPQAPTEGTHPSRFAHLRPAPDGQGALLDCPAAAASWRLEPAGAARIAALLAGADDPEAMALLARSGFAAPSEGPDAATWEFHDAVFHAASRTGRDGVAIGPTLRFLGRLPPPPALRPDYAGATIALPPPDPAGWERASQPLARVMEERKSQRDFTGPGPSLAQMGELLYRCLRIRRVWTYNGMDYVDRPLPCGGGLQELDYYLAVHRSPDLAAGFYHYQSDRHALCRVSGPSAPLDQMLREAGRYVTRRDEPPQVLMVMTSRLPRLAWKYEGLAYRLTLLNAGVAMQTLHLAAADMGLGACAAGVGDSGLFAALSGTDPATETAVGEMVFGTTGTQQRPHW